MVAIVTSHGEYFYTSEVEGHEPGGNAAPNLRPYEDAGPNVKAESFFIVAEPEQDSSRKKVLFGTPLGKEEAELLDIAETHWILAMGSKEDILKVFHAEEEKYLAERRCFGDRAPGYEKAIGELPDGEEVCFMHRLLDLNSPQDGYSKLQLRLLGEHLEAAVRQSFQIGSDTKLIICTA